MDEDLLYPPTQEEMAEIQMLKAPAQDDGSDSGEIDLSPPTPEELEEVQKMKQGGGSSQPAQTKQGYRDITIPESVVAGIADGASYGFADEALSVPLALIQEGKTFGDKRLTAQQKLRKYLEEARRQNFKSFTGGQLGGAIASPVTKAGGAAMGAAKGLSKIPTAAATLFGAGALDSYGHSDESGIATLPEALTGGAVGLGVGGGVAATGSLLRGAKNVIGRKTGLIEPQIVPPPRFLQRPKEVLDAPNVETQSRTLGDSISKIGKEAADYSGKAINSAVKEGASIKGGTDLLDILAKHRRSILEPYKGDVSRASPEKQAVIKKIDELSARYSPKTSELPAQEVYDNAYLRTKVVPGKKVTTPRDVSPQEVKELMQELDGIIKWDKTVSAGHTPADKAALKGLRADIREMMRNYGGEGYRKNLDEAAKRMEVKKLFPKPPKHENDYRRFEETINRAGRRKAPAEALEKIDKLAKTNLKESALDLSAKEELRRLLNSGKGASKGEAMEMASTMVGGRAGYFASKAGKVVKGGSGNISGPKYPSSDSLSSADYKEIYKRLSPAQRREVDKALAGKTPKRALTMLKNYASDAFSPENLGVAAAAFQPFQ